MSKTYILQKDLPDSKAGDRYTLVDGLYHLNGNQRKGYWTEDIVENNPEWFLLEQDISELLKLNGDWITIIDNGMEYVLPVKTLLELVKHRDELHGVKKVWINPEIKYTEQDMRECFRNSRRKSTLQSPWQTGEFSWLSFDHYMSFVKQPKYKIPPLE